MQPPEQTLILRGLQGAEAAGNEKRIERYFLRKMAYKLFGKFMGKTINKI